MERKRQLKKQLQSVENLRIGTNSRGELVFTRTDQPGQFVLKEKCAPEKYSAYYDTKLANVLKRLDYPGLPHIHAIECDEDIGYMLMDEVQGVSLRQTIAEDWYRDDPFVNGLSLFGFRVVLQILDALVYLHSRKLYYGNLWMDDVMLREGRVYLTDFSETGFQSNSNQPESFSVTTDLEELGHLMPLLMLPNIRADEPLNQKQTAVIQVSERAKAHLYPSSYEMKLDLMTLILQ